MVYIIRNGNLLQPFSTSLVNTDMKVWLYLILFLILNFTALYLGSIWTSDGVASEWYQNLNKAPWSPPGWFFGFAWTTIMICYSIYLTIVYFRIKGGRLGFILLYALQWILNILWNPTFFHFQFPNLALIVLILLTLVLSFQMFGYKRYSRYTTFLILPYFIWLLVATSLNMYIVIQN